MSDNNSISNSIPKDEREDKGCVGSGFVKADKIEYVRCEDAKLGCTLGTAMKAIVEVFFKKKLGIYGRIKNKIKTRNLSNFKNKLFIMGSNKH